MYNTSMKSQRPSKTQRLTDNVCHNDEVCSGTVTHSHTIFKKRGQCDCSEVWTNSKLAVMVKNVQENGVKPTFI